MFNKNRFLTVVSLSAAAVLAAANGFTATTGGIIHDAEYNKLLEQHGEKWAAEDSVLDKKLAALKAKYGKSPNIIHLMWDDSGYGDVGSPLLTRIHGIDTPNIAKRDVPGYLPDSWYRAAWRGGNNRGDPFAGGL